MFKPFTAAGPALSALGISALGLVSLGFTAPLAGSAQVGPGTFSGVRAINLARNTAIKLNGGLSVYQPAACMFNNGTDGGSCLVALNERGYLYRFQGGPPGWQQLGLAPSTETELLVSPDGRSVRELIYNGVPR
jgi:hypothetical protein